jgi:hypothetical protein
VYDNDGNPLEETRFIYKNGNKQIDKIYRGYWGIDSNRYSYDKTGFLTEFTSKDSAGRKSGFTVSTTRTTTKSVSKFWEWVKGIPTPSLLMINTEYDSQGRIIKKRYQNFEGTGKPVEVDKYKYWRRGTDSIISIVTFSDNSMNRESDSIFDISGRLTRINTKYKSLAKWITYKKLFNYTDSSGYTINTSYIPEDTLREVSLYDSQHRLVDTASSQFSDPEDSDNFHFYYDKIGRICKMIRSEKKSGTPYKARVYTYRIVYEPTNPTASTVPSSGSRIRNP